MKSSLLLGMVFTILNLTTPMATAQEGLGNEDSSGRTTVGVAESSLIKAIRERTDQLKLDAGLPSFDMTYLCDRRLVVVHPLGHDLDLFLPTQGGASTSKVSLEEVFNRIFLWMDSDYMLPTDPVAREAALKSISIEQPLVLLLLNRIPQRELFNIRYPDGVVLDEMVYHSLLPFSHEDCRGVPCAVPGSCANATGCLWEVHVPLCEFVNRGTARLLENRYGKLPQAVLGLSEIAEVLVTGGHYAYRNWGNEQPLLPHTERDGYSNEFSKVLKKRYAKKKERESFLVELLGWKGGHFSTEKYAASWGLGQVLLGHLKSSGKGKKQRSLGDLLYSIGEVEDSSPEAILEVILEYDPKFESTFKKKLPKKLLKEDRIWIGETGR